MSLTLRPYFILLTVLRRLGATLKVTPTGSYDDHTPNKTLGACFRTAFNDLGGCIPNEDIDYIGGKISASTDQGNISYAMVREPGIRSSHPRHKWTLLTPLLFHIVGTYRPLACVEAAPIE